MKNSILIKIDKWNYKKSFSSMEELEKWISNEQDYFGWVQNTTKKNNHLSNLNSRLNRFWQEIHQTINHANQQLENETKDQTEETYQYLGNKIGLIYTDLGPLISSSGEAKFINSIKDNDPVLAAFLLYFFIDRNLFFNDSKWIEAVFYGLQFLKGSESNIEFEKSSLLELKSTWEENYSKLRENYIDLNIKERELGVRHENQLKTQKNKFNEFIESGTEEINNIANTYDQQMSLQSSVSYWNKRWKRHNKLAKIFGYVSLVTGIALTGCLIGFSLHLLEGMDPSTYWKLAILGIATSFSAWIVRILVKIFLSNLHLSTDAKERVTMIKTYLAMLRDGEGLADEDRQIILQTVFRPSHVGIVKDEGSPANIIEAASNAIKGSRN